MAARVTAGKLYREERKIESEEKKIESKEKQIARLEKEIVFEIGGLRLSKKHVFDFTKVVGGALLGTGLGNTLRSYAALAELPWLNVFGIFLLSIIIAGLLLYKSEREQIVKSKGPALFLVKKIFYVYVISFVIVAATSVLFVPSLLTNELTMLKIIFISSFSAVAGAITFSLF